MRGSLFTLTLVFTLGACRGPKSAPPEPSSAPPPSTTAAPAPPSDRPAAFDPSGFDPPFSRVPLSEAFVRAHELRRITLHEDSRTEDSLVVDHEVTTFDYDRQGRPLQMSEQYRKAPMREIRYEYAGDRLISEIHRFPDGKQSIIRYAYDEAGRVVDIERDQPMGTIEEHNTYDEHGRLSLAVQHSGEDRAEQRLFYDQDDRLQRVIMRLPDTRVITTEYAYGTEGRPTRWVRTDSRGGVDTYEFSWDAQGRLRSQSFTDDGTPIYRRTYAYDEDGRPIREELQSFVPAMGRGSVIRYAYERHDELPRETIDPPGTGPTHAELLAATRGAFSGAYEELARITYETTGEDRFTPDSVTVYIPEAVVSRRTEDELKQQACAAKQALGFGCDCERVTLGEPLTHAWHSWPDKRVVPLTFHLGIGC